MMGLNHVLDGTLPLPVRTPSQLMPWSLRQLAVVIVVLTLLTPPSVVQGFGTCRTSFRCLNGGVERYGTSIFSPCRCRCSRRFTGPRCQYRLAPPKRSSSLNVLNDFLQARLRAERQQLQQEEEEGQEAFVSSDRDNYGVPPLQRQRRDSMKTVQAHGQIAF